MNINEIFKKVSNNWKEHCKIIVAEKTPSGMSLSKWQLRIFLYVRQHSDNPEAEKIYYFRLNKETEKSLNNENLKILISQLYDADENAISKLDSTFNKGAGYKPWIGKFSNFKEDEGKNCEGAPVTVLQFNDKFDDTKKLRDICIKKVSNGVTSLRNFIENTLSKGGRKCRTLKKRVQKFKRNKRN